MKIRLAAIAKDEGAYLPEWIYWHLQLGFDDIHICINNTNDNSHTITKSIALKYPVSIQQISTDSAFGFNNHLIDEHFKARNPLQSQIYADIYEKSRQEQFSHVMFLDIDEFLFTQGQSIHQLVAIEHSADILLFNWFNVCGEEKQFSHTGDTLKGEKSPFTKYLLKTALQDIQFVSTHNVAATYSCKRLFARNNTTNNSNYIKNSAWTDEAFILHRHLRSQAEYLSLLSRGDTWNNSYIGLKNNRQGWSNKGKQSVVLNNMNMIEYQHNFAQFLIDCHIQDELTQAREYVLNRAKQTQETISQMMSLNRDLDRVLRGTGLKHVDRRMKYQLKRWLTDKIE